MDKNEVLKYYYGYDKLKTEQEKIIDSILSGNDTIGILPTGFGKSVCFQIPALILSGITIVITPLISLMQDQVNNLKKKNIEAEYINSLLSYDEQEVIYEKIRNGSVKLLYVSAERLKNNEFKRIISSVEVSLIVCDEAHTLLWSEDFRFSLAEIPTFINMLKNRPYIMALTATSTDTTTRKIISLLNMKNPNIISFDCDRKNIFYKVINTNNKDRDLYFYLKDKKDIHGIIYCLTINHVIHVSDFLKSKGFNVSIYHGSLDSKEKKYIQDKYTKNNIKIIVATNAFGMGIDIPDIRYVIEYDIPQSIEDFSQQVGRASRDGKYAEGVILFNLNDRKTIEYFIDNIEENNRSKKELDIVKTSKYKKLDNVIKMCMTNTCIHKYVSNYFGMKHSDRCNMCSNCKRSKFIF